MTSENYLNLDSKELDKPVYRIMPVSRLLQCLEEKQLVLVPPRKWDDPFENYLLSAKIKLSDTGEFGDMGRIRDKVYGQCWTQYKETDAMWRIYSSDKSGAKVRTTPRKLLDALKGCNPQFGDITCFIGKVQYQTQKDLVSTLMKLKLLTSNGSGIAKSLLYKRVEFRHEKEVRLIYTDGEGLIHPVGIDPNKLFDEIVFDPRMDIHLYAAYAAAVKTKNFSGRVAQSVLYKPPKELLIKM
ncbi:MAG: DUF2971 domain-containing protein [Nitrosomonas sp.]|nr:DUF2971 domain-containing protein [Nitrosomonas sp.]MCW5618366.1 DUF2971 domain-containing protein [Nitrosomonas sp.]